MDHFAHLNFYLNDTEFERKTEKHATDRVLQNVLIFKKPMNDDFNVRINLQLFEAFCLWRNALSIHLKHLSDVIQLF